MSLLFEWDASKARLNLKKQGISFEEATTSLEILEQLLLNPR
jgi:uncharacterized DUF497 family protein